MTMPTTINSKIILSGAAIFAAAALIIGATFAFFSDTETSLGNTLQAGSLDLKIDSEAHYAGLVCAPGNDGTVWTLPDGGSTTREELIGEPCEGTWALKDLEEDDTFFELLDLKPGDQGENTLSLHVYDNDAWGQIRVTSILDQDNDCTEPESEAGDVQCPDPGPSPTPTPDVNGELSENLNFFLWLDEGTVPGFQCANPVTPSPEPSPAPCDPEEGDNVFNGNETVTVADSVFQSGDDIILALAPGLAEASSDPACTALDGTGHYNYGPCHGLADDGRLVGSATYYIGVAWCLGDVIGQGECDGSSVGNEAQTDSISADISFDITQHRNQDNPYVVPGP